MDDAETLVSKFAAMGIADANVEIFLTFAKKIVEAAPETSPTTPEETSDGCW